MLGLEQFALGNFGRLNGDVEFLVDDGAVFSAFVANGFDTVPGLAFPSFDVRVRYTTFSTSSNSEICLNGTMSITVFSSAS